MEDSPICPYLSKVTHLYRGVFPKALRSLLQLETVKQGAKSFLEFLNNRKESLFHLRGKPCCCNFRQKRSLLNDTDWNIIFTTISSQCPNEGNGCFHVFKAREWLTVEALDFSLVCVLLRNICHSRYESIIKTAQTHRNEVIHTDKSSINEEEFELLWRKAQTSVSDIAACVSQELKEQILAEVDKIYKYKPSLTRYLETTLCEVEEHKKDDSFLPPHVLGCVLKSLEHNGIVIIVGYPGSGKSSIGLEVIRNMSSKDLTVIKFNRIQLWNELVNPASGSVAFIDDFLGVSNTTSAGILELKPFFSTIYACVKNSNTKVILTVRKSIYERWRGYLEETRLFESEHMIDLTLELFRISVEEKVDMLRSHLQSRGIWITRTKKEAEESEMPSIDQFTIDVISQTNAFNFPLLCFLFTKSKNLRLGPKFFEQPRSTLVKTIEEFRKCSHANEKWKYAVLSYTAVSGNTINPRKLNMNCMIIIAKSLGLKFQGNHEIKIAASAAVMELKDEYLRQNGRDTFEFIHQSFLEATVLSCGAVFPNLVVEYCNNDTLFELIRTESYLESEGDLVLKLDEDSHEVLVKRFISEIVSNPKTIPHVLFHSVMDDNGFSDKFFGHLQSSIKQMAIPSKDIDVLLIAASKLGHIRAVKACFSANNPQRVLEEAVNHASYNNHGHVVELLAKDIKPDPYFLQACSFGCWDVVRSFLNNGFVEDLDLMKEGIFRSSKAGHSKLSNELISIYKRSTEPIIFKRAMLKVLIDAIETEKESTVREIISCQELDIDTDDLGILVLESCYSNQLDLARFLLQKFCNSNFNIDTYEIRWILLKGSKTCIDLVFEMEELFTIQDFFENMRINFILTSIMEGRYILKKALERFPDLIKRSIYTTPSVLIHCLWIGCHSVVSRLLLENADLSPRLQKHDKIADKYSVAEFAAFCGFSDLRMITENFQEEQKGLLYCCVQGYRNKGRIDDAIDIFDYDKSICKDAGVNYFETDSRQQGYFLCLQTVYDEATILQQESPIFNEIMAIMYDNFGSMTLTFLEDQSTATSQSMLTLSSCKMEVLKLLVQILFQNLDRVRMRKLYSDIYMTLVDI